MARLSKKVLRWEPLVKQFAGQIPVKFGLTIIAHESTGDPTAVSRTGARGLMQITGVALETINKALGVTYTRADLFDPKINVMVGMALLNSIVQNWEWRHPDTLSPRWSSPQWLALLVLAWNAGSSEKSGVGYVVTTMERGGLSRSQITVDTVSQAAKNLPRASQWLTKPERVAWAKKVARDYLKITSPIYPETRKSAWPWVLLGGAALGTVAYVLLRPKKGGASAVPLSLSPEQVNLLKG